MPGRSYFRGDMFILGGARASARLCSVYTCSAGVGYGFAEW